MNTHTFGEAVDAMKKGKYARLPHWQPGVYMYLYQPEPGSPFNTQFFCMRTATGNFPCEPTQTGILSEQWEIKDSID